MAFTGVEAFMITPAVTKQPYVPLRLGSDAAHVITQASLHTHHIILRTVDYSSYHVSRSRTTAFPSRQSLLERRFRF